MPARAQQRAAQLVKTHVGTQAQLDDAQTALDQANAALVGADAQIAAAQANIGVCRRSAPNPPARWPRCS